MPAAGAAACTGAWEVTGASAGAACRDACEVVWRCRHAATRIDDEGGRAEAGGIGIAIGVSSIAGGPSRMTGRAMIG